MAVWSLWLRSRGSRRTWVVRDAGILRARQALDRERWESHQATAWCDVAIVIVKEWAADDEVVAINIRDLKVRIREVVRLA